MIERVEFAAEQAPITVQASSAHPDVLSVQDAMQQVLDFFELLTPEDAKETKFVWKLKIASTNSPFTVQGEAVSLEAGVNMMLKRLASGLTVAPERPACPMEV